MRLDFIARQPQYIDHLAPVWRSFPRERRGVFFVAYKHLDYAKQELGEDNLFVYEENPPETRKPNPILSCSYGDLSRAAVDGKRMIISMEHGTGHTFGTAGYPDGKGKRDLVSLSLMPNEYTARKARAVRDTRCEIIGTPKTDDFLPWGKPVLSKEPVIGIGWHWGDKNSDPPESGSAFEHYRLCLPELAGRYNVIGTGHPLSRHIFEPEFKRLGIEYVPDFREVVFRADVYINDLSSALYEFMVSGKPVIVLNAPWFRRDVNFGIRFWDYSDVGINVEKPDDLVPAIERTLAEYNTIHVTEREKATEDLYPYLGHSTHRAVEVLINYLDEMKEIAHAP